MCIYPPLRWALFLLAFLCCAGLSRAGGQENSPLPETYRLRVENTLYGRVEMSADGGAHYALVGRVLRPVAMTLPEKVATTPGIVLRSSKEGLAFSVAPGQVLKLRPHADDGATAPGKPTKKPFLPHPPEASALVTNMEPGQGPFGDLAPPFRCPVRLQAGPTSLAPLPDSYTPSDEDVFVFLVSLPPAPPAGSPAVSQAQRAAEWNETVHRHIETLAQNYAAGALERAQADKRRIVSGFLKLNAKLPDKEPDPIAAVTYAVDGDVVAAQNSPPWTYTWDTKRVPDGEHVVEIRALNGNTAILTRARTLLLVQNSKTQERPPPPPK